MRFEETARRLGARRCGLRWHPERTVSGFGSEQRMVSEAMGLGSRPECTQGSDEVIVFKQWTGGALGERPFELSSLTTRARALYRHSRLSFERSPASQATAHFSGKPSLGEKGLIKVSSLNALRLSKVIALQPAFGPTTIQCCTAALVSC